MFATIADVQMNESTIDYFDATSAASPIVVVSPHYDDAVFSCGGLIGVSPCLIVATVYTGLPANPGVLTDGDRRCGFSSAGEAMRERAAENRKALALLHADNIDFGFLDSQYVRDPDNGSDLLTSVLAAAIAQIQPAAIFFPLGLFHSDHIRVSDALIALSSGFRAIQWSAYEDIPYRKNSQLVVQRLSQLKERGVNATSLRIEGAPGNKSAAVEAYRSQFRGLGYEDGRPILHQPEQYWRLRSTTEQL